MVTHDFAAFPYLIACLGGLAVLLIGLAVCPDQRKPALAAGLLAAPFSLAAILLVPTYWNPRLVWSVWNVGLEDLLFCFVTGGLAWLMAAVLCRRPITVRLQPRHLLAWYATFNCCGLATLLLFWKLGCDPMTAALISFAIGIAVLLFLRPAAWRLAVAGALGFGAAYLLLTRLWFAILPGFVQHWPATSRWSRPVGGLPLGEIVWALIYGACWPLVLAFLFRAEFPAQAPAARPLAADPTKGAS